MKNIEYIKLSEVYPEEIIEVIKDEDEYFELKEALANLMGHLYKNVQWQKVSGNSLAPNIFQHRLYFAAKESHIENFIEKISSSLDIQCPFFPMEIMLIIKKYPNAMNLLREQTRVFTAYAMKLSKEFKKRKEEMKKNES